MAFINFSLLLLLLASISIPPSNCQTPSPPPSDACNGIFLTYAFESRTAIAPHLRDLTLQPYAFSARATILNNGVEDLLSWNLFVGFQHNEILVSASRAVLSDGTIFPARVGNGTSFSGFPNTDLKTAIETAGDLSQIQVVIDLVGTQFGVLNPEVPMPSNITLANDGYNCSRSTRQGNNTLQVCCTKDPNFRANITEEGFLSRQDGDLTIAYDVIQSHGASYLAQVTMSNESPLGRLDNWKLSWQWMRGEFIDSVRGAYATIVDPSKCIYGDQGAYYQDFDFTNIASCERTPTIVDLPPTMYNDTTLGLIPSCCRNGTILPKSMDPSRSSSAFQLQVHKMPPDINRTQLFPPQNWKISGDLNPDYQCGPPVRVNPTQFPDPSGLPSTIAAISSWQVVCNITQPRDSSPRCCVSFSSFYNESVIPCKTCACGCPNNSSRSCSTTATALMLPSEALLIPFANRTTQALAWADIKHFPVPNPLPCADNCGVSINWHLYTDYNRGWTARITLFNWNETNYVDWFVAVELDKAMAGYENVYSFNGSVLPDVNNTLFMQGLPGLNYLVAETDSANPTRDPRVPGKQQSVISFTKRMTPGINVVNGDGFPTKVFFNGEECSLPSILPTARAHRSGLAKSFFFVVMAVVSLFLMEL